MKIPIILWEDFPACEVCGRPILKPGICEVCAGLVKSVDKVLEVSCRVLIEPGDLLDDEP